MFSNLLEKLKESLLSVLPVAAMVGILVCTPLVSLSETELIVFAVCTVLLVIGMALFSLGADLSMTPMGYHIGSGLTKSKKPVLLLSVCFLMGVLITVAEPDLSVLARQVSSLLNSTELILFVGIGVGLFLLLAVLKIIFHKSLPSLLMFFYMVMFSFAAMVALNGNGFFLPVSFDAGGVTTGPVTVPFIMALGIGIAATVGGNHSEENSFGMISLCSAGPILAVLFLGIRASGTMSFVLPDYSISSKLGNALVSVVLSMMGEVALALGLVVAFFLLLNLFVLKLPFSKLLKCGIGILYTYVGLVVFLTAADVGFMPIGYSIGIQLAEFSNVWTAVFAFLLGMVVVLAEPAVHVLNRQVEAVTGGTVSKRSMMIALSLGVGISIALSVLRILFDFNILYYLIPGYLVSLGLSLFVPGIYTAIAFDSGGVASGPMTSSFILPFCIGICCVWQGQESVLTDAFGVVAMVAMTPLITIQMLGFRAIISQQMRTRRERRRILAADDEQIINFEL